jgi:hypothetical protein
MSYHMMGGSRGSYEPMPPSYAPPSFPQHSLYPPPAQNTSIALFHIPQDATNSLYVDGVPNDAAEREVSRTILPSQTYSAPTRASNASDSSRRPPWAGDSTYCASWTSRMYCSPPSPSIRYRIIDLTNTISKDSRSVMLKTSRKLSRISPPKSTGDNNDPQSVNSNLAFP